MKIATSGEDFAGGTIVICDQAQGNQSFLGGGGEMAEDAVCAAGAAAIRAASPGHRVSLIWESEAAAITFNWNGSRWSWVAYDRRGRRLLGTGFNPTIEDAVDQAWLKAKPAARAGGGIA